MSEKPIRLTKKGLPDKRASNRGVTRERRNRTAIQTEHQVVELLALGRPATEIAKTLDTSRSNVEAIKARWRHVFTELDNVKEYKDLRVDFLSAAEFKVLRSMLQPDKLEKASHNNLAYGFSQIFNARRLEAGQSTSNTQIQSFVKVDLSDIKE